MKKPFLVALTAIVAASGGLALGYVLFLRGDGHPVQSQPSAGGSRHSPPVSETAGPTPSPSSSQGEQPQVLSPGSDPKVTLATILDAKKRGDSATVGIWAGEEAIAQLSSFPPDAFDPDLISCAADPQRPESDVLCTLTPARPPVGHAVARMRKTGDQYRLVQLVPVVD